MSSTRKGPSASSTSLVAPTNARRPSSSPDKHLDGRAQHLGRRGRRSRVRRSPREPLASRPHALVAAPCASTTSRYSASASSVRVTPSASRRPVRSVERPRRVVTTRRSSVTEPARMSSRVEFVPQSMTATGTASEGTTRLRVLAQLAGDPTTDGVVAPGEEGCVVSVEALHALARAADATRWSRTLMTGGDGRVALLGVRGVARPRAPRGRRRALGCRARPRPLRAGSPRLHSAFPTSQKRVGIGVPSSRSGRVADHDGPAVGIADDDIECATRRSAEQLGDDGDVVHRDVDPLAAVTTPHAAREQQDEQPADHDRHYALRHRRARTSDEVDRLGLRMVEPTDRRRRLRVRRRCRRFRFSRCHRHRRLGLRSLSGLGLRRLAGVPREDRRLEAARRTGPAAWR